jgi:hypothetical protein
MSSPSEKQLNDHLRKAVRAIPADYAEEIWNTPVEKADSDAWFLEEKKQTVKKPRSYVRWAGLAAACFAVIFLGWFQIYRVTDATVYLDVNPSVTLDINRIGKVVSACADNEDGVIILDNMHLRGTDVDVAMNALLGSMVKHGYLSQDQSTLLISVNGKNESRTTALQQRLVSNAGQTLETLLGKGIVLGQSVEPDDDAEDIAEQYGITPGKAALILRLLKDQSSWSIQELAAMPMTDLIRYCQAAGIDISQYLGEDGEIIGDLDSLLDDDDPDDPDDKDDHDDKDDYDDDGSDDHDNDDDDDNNDSDDESNPDDDASTDETELDKEDESDDIDDQDITDDIDSDDQDESNDENDIDDIGDDLEDSDLDDDDLDENEQGDDLDLDDGEESEDDD